jgi:hypothetical protein
VELDSDEDVEEAPDEDVEEAPDEESAEPEVLLPASPEPASDEDVLEEELVRLSVR